MLEFSNKYFTKEVTDLKDFITVVYILIDDRDAVWELVEAYEHITILEDKGYANKYLSRDLETEKGIQLLFMKRDYN